MSGEDDDTKHGAGVTHEHRFTLQIETICEEQSENTPQNH